ncbi:arsenical resistance protein ArsH [Entomortierella parvispora]|uniref:Arsenical resistance protein ArsH n=1 Tax=Entomortierella parvispora TaxID=205924 RepID=A0A9P3H8H3_9FUNG|nr:arsenical resistance protein ArsH [Entomortierella parvispora]
MLPYKPYRVLKNVASDWVAKLNLSSLQALGKNHAPVNVLVLYGSLRERSFSRLLAFEFARILDRLGADVRVFDPTGLPMKDGVSENHPKVQELRELSQWSHAHVWVSPEQHGNITAVFKNQIDWIPLALGSVRPTQGRTLAIAQVCGGSQSFNAVNTLRILGRWMRMFTVPNQSSVPKAWTEFDDDDRMKPGDLRQRVVDVAEELFKFTIILRPQTEFLVDRHSEREEKEKNGRLLSQADKLQ